MYWSSSCVFVVSHCCIHLVGSLTLSIKVHVFSYKVTNTQCRAVAELQLKEFVCVKRCASSLRGLWLILYLSEEALSQCVWAHLRKNCQAVAGEKTRPALVTSDRTALMMRVLSSLGKR